MVEAGDTKCFDYMVYGVMDSHGNMWAGVSPEPADDVQVCGMKDKEGKDLHFESEAYHLQDWCKKNGLKYVEDVKEGSVWFPTKKGDLND